jgi:DNA-binding MarR family transcriptional regulator
MTSIDPLRELLNRLVRLLSADQRQGVLNPVQRAALTYLARANRFSRQPSHVADYLAATRGTTSQTLKSLLKKGYVSEEQSSTDRRITRLSLTAAGQRAADESRELDRLLEILPEAERQALSAGLGKIVTALIVRRGGRSFGLCATCRFHQTQKAGAFCGLLQMPLTAQEPNQICQEHAP